jgi:predicted metal-dependent hydrolase
MNISIKSTAKIRVAVPQGVSFDEAEQFAYSKSDWIQKKILKISKSRNILKEVNREQARIQLKERIDFLSEKYNFKYNKLFIKNQKTRWGSCSGKNNINLNAKLLNLPQKLIDYVILHELVHTKVKNHSSEFWFTLESYMDDSKKYDKELKKYSL